MGTPSLVRGQVQSARRSDHRTGNKGFLDGTNGLPGWGDGEMESRETRRYTRAIFGDGELPGGQPRLKNDSAARSLDTSRSDYPRAVRNEGRARSHRRRATSPRPGRSDQSRPHPHRQVGRMVGVVSGRTTSDFRRGLAPYRDRPWYLPAIARRLYHCRGLDEPFDFLTWFEYAPADAAPLEQLVTRLRNTREWDYVEREIDIRLAR